MTEQEILDGLEAKGFHGTIARYQRGDIVLEEAEAELKGARPKVKILPPFEGPLIFGRSWEEIQRMQHKKA